MAEQKPISRNSIVFARGKTDPDHVAIATPCDCARQNILNCPWSVMLPVNEFLASCKYTKYSDLFCVAVSALPKNKSLSVLVSHVETTVGVTHEIAGPCSSVACWGEANRHDS